MQELDATFGQYLFNLCFYLLLCFFSWKSMYKNKNQMLIWLLVVVFCIYSFFAGDWFHYKIDLPFIDKDYSEPIYYYFAEISLRNYTLFRLMVWGLATLFFLITCSRLNLNKNISAFVFIWFFLPTFCYARASLAMASYFCGLSFIVNTPLHAKRLSCTCIGVLLIILSYFFHRSFLPIIAVTPLVFIKYNKKTILLLILLFPLVLALVRNSLNQIASDVLSTSDEFEPFSDAAQGYASQERRVYNWKYTLVSNIKYIGFYLPLLFIIIRTKFSRNRFSLPKHLDRYFSIAVVILIVSTSFFVLSYTDNTSQVLGYRFLYMTGIPTTLLISYALQTNALSSRKSLALMSLSWLSTLALIVGKLFALA